MQCFDARGTHPYNKKGKAGYVTLLKIRISQKEFNVNTTGMFCEYCLEIVDFKDNIDRI